MAGLEPARRLSVPGTARCLSPRRHVGRLPGRYSRRPVGPTTAASSAEPLRPASSQDVLSSRSSVPCVLDDRASVPWGLRATTSATGFRVIRGSVPCLDLHCCSSTCLPTVPAVVCLPVWLVGWSLVLAYRVFDLAKSYRDLETCKPPGQRSDLGVSNYFQDLSCPASRARVPLAPSGVNGSRPGAGQGRPATGPASGCPRPPRSPSRG